MGHITIALWLFTSVVCCLFYSIKILTLQIFEGPPRNLIADGNSDLFWMDQVQGQEVRSLSEIEVNAIKKSKLKSHDQLSWVSKKRLKSLRQFSIEMTTVVNNEPVSVDEEVAVLDILGFQQDDDESSQDICAICLENIEIGAWYKKLPKCQHSFHAICTDQWLTQRAACPVCREEVFIEENELKTPITVSSNNLERSAPLEIIIHSERSESDLNVCFPGEVS